MERFIRLMFIILLPFIVIKGCCGCYSDEELRVPPEEPPTLVYCHVDQTEEQKALKDPAIGKWDCRDSGGNYHRKDESNICTVCCSVVFGSIYMCGCDYCLDWAGQAEMSYHVWGGCVFQDVWPKEMGFFDMDGGSCRLTLQKCQGEDCDGPGDPCRGEYGLTNPDCHY